MIGPIALERSRFWGLITHDKRNLEKPSIKNELDLALRSQMSANSNDGSLMGAAARITVLRGYLDLDRSESDYKEIGKALRERTQKLSVDNKEDMRFLAAFEYNVEREKDYVLMLSLYDESGRNNFQFGPSLVQEFTQTDVEDISCRELNFPYPTGYYKFEGLEGTDLDGQPLDGFLISHDADKNYIVIMPMTSSPLSSWGCVTEDGRVPRPLIHILLDDSEDKSLYQAIIDAMRSMLKGATDSQERYFYGIEGLDDPAEYEEKRLDLINPQVSVWARLIVNALMTVDNGGIETERVYSSDAPKDLASKALSNKPGAAKAEKKLKGLGYVTLKQYEVPDQIEATYGEASYSITPHWRRGHWRRQHYGPGKTQVKRIRIAPTIVKGKEGDPQVREGYRIGS